MFNFRYHLISLVAVFLALGVGILLGVGISDAGIVSTAQENIQESLRGDLDRALEGESDARAEVEAHKDFEAQVYPSLVSGALEGKRIEVVASGRLPNDIVVDIREALKPTGGKLTTINVLRTPVDIEGLKESQAQGSGPAIGSDFSVFSELGRDIGYRMAAGTAIPRRLRGPLFASRAGSRAVPDAIIYYRQPLETEGDGRRATDLLEGGLIAGLKESAKPIVAIETQATEPSQVSYYRRAGLTTVDDVDIVPGWVALVFTLNGATGNFGVKPQAELLVPPTVGVTAQPAGRR